MKESMRAKRMAKNHRRMGQASKLNLVSLMDIFTILVFFLLINSSDVEILSAEKAIELPESQASQKPQTTLLIKVNNEEILVGTRSIAKVKDILTNSSPTIDVLQKELTYLASRRPLTEEEKEKGRPITIMGDQAVPYALLKRIMATCAESDFRDISLAVTQIFSNSTTSTVPVSGTSGVTP